MRESRFGLALVIESTLGSGGYVLGFRLDPPERLHKITEELQNLYKVHIEHPELGVHYSVTTLVSEISLFILNVQNVNYATTYKNLNFHSHCCQNNQPHFQKK